MNEDWCKQNQSYAVRLNQLSDMPIFLFPTYIGTIFYFKLVCICIDVLQSSYYDANINLLEYYASTIRGAMQNIEMLLR